jgi:hypothetical protein
VGISGFTAVSVLRQYLNIIVAAGYYSQLVRSDYGKKILFIADAHHQFYRTRDSNIIFRDIYYFGRSNENQYIEL